MNMLHLPPLVTEEFFGCSHLNLDKTVYICSAFPKTPSLLHCEKVKVEQMNIVASRKQNETIARILCCEQLKFGSHNQNQMRIQSFILSKMRVYHIFLPSLETNFGYLSLNCPSRSKYNFFLWLKEPETAISFTWHNVALRLVFHWCRWNSPAVAATGGVRDIHLTAAGSCVATSIEWHGRIHCTYKWCMNRKTKWEMLKVRAEQFDLIAPSHRQP